MANTVTAQAVWDRYVQSLDEMRQAASRLREQCIDPETAGRLVETLKTAQRAGGAERRAFYRLFPSLPPDLRKRSALYGSCGIVRNDTNDGWDCAKCGAPVPDTTNPAACCEHMAYGIQLRAEAAAREAAQGEPTCPACDGTIGDTQEIPAASRCICDDINEAMRDAGLFEEIWGDDNDEEEDEG